MRTDPVTVETYGKPIRFDPETGEQIPHDPDHPVAKLIAQKLSKQCAKTVVKIDGEDREASIYWDMASDD